MLQLSMMQLFITKFQRPELTGFHWFSLYFLSLLACHHFGSLIPMDSEQG